MSGASVSIDWPGPRPPVIPNVALGLFGLPTTTEIWVHVLGYSLLAVAGDFLVAARREVTDLFRISIAFRLGLLVVFGLLVAAGSASPALLLLAVSDVIFALWTALGLRRPRV